MIHVGVLQAKVLDPVPIFKPFLLVIKPIVVAIALLPQTTMDPFRMLDRMLLKDERIFRLVKKGSLPGYKVYWVNQQKLQQHPHGGNMHVLPK